MPYVIPTANQLQTRFPAFAAVDDAYIDLIILEASRSVDESWLEDDYQNAIMYLAAHIMFSEGVTGDIDPATTGAIVSDKLGDASTTYANHTTSSSSSDYGTTIYGRGYLRLLRLNHPAVAVI